MAKKTLVRINGRPMKILMKGVQLNGIPVLVVKPAPEEKETQKGETK